MKKTMLMIAALLGISAHAASNKILVVLSSENKITLKGGVTHPTGFFLSELAVPLRGLVQAGYEPVFATPQGNAPTMDRASDSAQWFGGNEEAYQEAKRLLDSLTGLSKPLSLAQVRKLDLDEFAGIFIPGGHAPMEDLLVDLNLGHLLKHFHKEGKPTALICHGPIALLSALPRPKEFTNALSKGKTPRQQNWVYAGYKMTSFSTAEEMQEEPGQDNVLGGFVKFYPDVALRKAGGSVKVANKWDSHVVRDRELITGQNPMSDSAFTDMFIKALSE